MENPGAEEVPNPMEDALNPVRYEAQSNNNPETKTPPGSEANTMVNGCLSSSPTIMAFADTNELGMKEGETEAASQMSAVKDEESDSNFEPVWKGADCQPTWIKDEPNAETNVVAPQAVPNLNDPAKGEDRHLIQKSNHELLRSGPSPLSSSVSVGTPSGNPVKSENYHPSLPNGGRCMNMTNSVGNVDPPFRGRSNPGNNQGSIQNNLHQQQHPEATRSTKIEDPYSFSEEDAFSGPVHPGQMGARPPGQIGPPPHQQYSQQQQTMLPPPLPPGHPLHPHHPHIQHHQYPPHLQMTHPGHQHSSHNYDPSLMMNHLQPQQPPRQLKQEHSGERSRRSFDEYSEGSDICEDDAADPDDNIVIREDNVKQEDEAFVGTGDQIQMKSEKKPRKKQNRFNGLSEEELSKRLLPDLIAPDLDILIIGINPGMYAAFKGHHYAGPGNHFWKCMFLSGLLPRPMTADDDGKLLQYGIGFTNIVERTTRGSSNLTRREIEEGTLTLTEKIRKFRPKIAVFNGKGIYEIFCNRKQFFFGKQPEKISGTDTHVWVMPNSSARCAQLPRAVDKVPFYSALKLFCDYLKGLVPTLNENDLVFKDVKLQNFNEKPFKQELKYEPVEGGECGGGFGEGDPRIPEAGKKKRGRPPKPRVDGVVPAPKRRVVDENGLPVQRGSNPIDPLTGKKKRGRPKKPEGAPVSHHKKKKTTNGKKRESVDSQDSTSYHHDPSQQQHQQPHHHPGMSVQQHPAIDNRNAQGTGGGVMPLPPFSPNFGRANSEMIEGGGNPPEARQQQQQQQQHHHAKQMHPGAEFDNPPHSRLQESGVDTRNQQRSNCDYPPNSRSDQQYPYQGYPPGASQQQQEQQQQQNFPIAASSGNPPFLPQGGFNSTAAAPNAHVNSGRGGNSQSFDSRIVPSGGSVPNPPPSKAAGNDDVASKSITGLESLVDQIPSLENDSGVYSGSGAGSHPNTPRSVGPYSPAAGTAPPTGGFHSSVFPGFPSAASSATVGSSSNQYVPSTSDNFPAGSDSASSSRGPDPGAGRDPQQQQSAPSNFSVSSLVTNASNGGSSSAPVASTSEPSTSSSGLMPPPSFGTEAFAVSSLSSSYAAAAAQAQADMASKYSGLAASAAASSPYMSGAFGSSFGSGFLGQPNSAFPSPAAAMSSMGAAAMGMGAMGAYYGAQYSQAAQQAANAAYGAASASAAATSGFPASPYSHGLPVPNPGYPYSPYPQSPYSQSPYF